MQENIISSIYNAYLDNEFEGIQPLRSNDLQSGYKKLNDFEKKHNISTAEQNEFYTEVLNEFTVISELKGFTNGFKLAARLLMEICDNSQIAEKKILAKNNEKSTDNDNLNDKKKGKMCECTLTDAKLLADSISDSLNLLYEFCIMHSGNTLEEIEMVDGSIFTIKAAAEKLSEIMEVLAT